MDTVRAAMPSTISARSNRKTRIWTHGLHAAKWIEANLSWTTGRWAGQPWVLLPEQIRWLIELLRTDRWGRLWHRTGYLSMGKKGGKTELVAATAIWLNTQMGEPNPVHYAAASAKGQASLLFDAMGQMVEAADCFDGLAKVLADEITIDLSDYGLGTATSNLVAASGGKLDGPSLSLATADEVHEWVEERQIRTWGVLAQGGGARECPLTLGLGTAGPAEVGLDWDHYQVHCAQMAKSAEVDDRWYSAIWEAHNVPDIWDDDAFRAGLAQANPAFGEIQNWEYYETMRKRRPESAVRRYFLNQREADRSAWPAAKKWLTLAGKPRFNDELPIYVGVDWGRTRDAAAVGWTQLGDGGKWQIGHKIWANPWPPSDMRHQRWIDDGGVDPNELMAFLVDLAAQFPAPAAVGSDMETPHPGPLISYDPAFFSHLAQQLHDGWGSAPPLNMNHWPQSSRVMVPTSILLEDLIFAGALVHSGDPVLNAHAKAVVMTESEFGRRIGKPKGSRQHIDGMVAVAIALQSAQHPDLGREEAPADAVYYFDSEDLDERPAEARAG